jgi:hypothetical protein
VSNVINQPRRPVGVFEDYADAQRAVDRLADSGFPVERIAIVGHDLKSVEQITGRMTTGRAALLGALQGATLGVLFGFLVGVLWTIPPATLLLMLYGLVAGGLLGALLGAVTHAAAGGERDFASVSGLQAQRYEVLVDEELAGRALELLQGFETRPAAREDNSVQASSR